MKAIDKLVSAFFKNRPRDGRIRTAVLEYDDHHMELDTVSRTLTYQNTFSCANAPDAFPAGYFDRKCITVGDRDYLQIRKALAVCMKELSFEERDVPFLPPGASQKAYMRCMDAEGHTFFYETTHLSKSGSSIETAPVRPEFTALYRLLAAQCDFPSLTSPRETTSQPNDADSRYFDETLWRCEKCGAFNLFEDRVCVKCSEDRGW